MTLEHLINSLCELAIHYNLVNWAGSGPSIYELNSETINDYPVLFISPTDDITVSKSTTTFGLTFYYVDRLLSDSMNETQIFSVAATTLINFIRQIKSLGGIVSVGDFNIRLFTNTEKMNDRCAGGYARVTITVVNTANCAQWFDETGAPIGTYIPSVIQDVSVLDSLASKPWVKQYVADNTSSGGTDEKRVQEMIDKSLEDYTKTSDFATINGSGITSGESYDLLERDVFAEFLSGYTQDIETLRESISAATPADYDEVRSQVSANTEDIRALSAATQSAITALDEAVEGVSSGFTGLNEAVESLSGTVSEVIGEFDTLSGTVSEVSEQFGTLSGTVAENVQNITNLSAFTSGLTFTLGEQGQKIEQLSGATSALTEGLAALSAATSGIGSDLGVLSGFTAQAVSSITSEVETLSGATSAALSGLSSDLAQLSATTSGIAVGFEVLSGKTPIIIDRNAMTAMTTEERAALVAELSATSVDRLIYIQGSDYIVPLVQRGASTLVFKGYYKGNQQVTYELRANGTYAGGSGYIYTLPSTVVSSSTVTTIWSGSLADYQTLGTYSNDTLYLII